MFGLVTPGAFFATTAVALSRRGGLEDPALELPAAIVRAADSKPSNTHPAGGGLRWIAHGFSALGLAGHEILAREFIVCDALYAGCKRRVAAGEVR